MRDESLRSDTHKYAEAVVSRSAGDRARRRIFSRDATDFLFQALRGLLDSAEASTQTAQAWTKKHEGTSTFYCCVVMSCAAFVQGVPLVLWVITASNVGDGASPSSSNSHAYPYTTIAIITIHETRPPVSPPAPTLTTAITIAIVTT